MRWSSLSVAGVLAVCACSPAPQDQDSRPDARPTPRPDGGGDPEVGCSGWAVGTLTGYNNSDSGDDPNSGNLMEFTNLNARFYAGVEIAAVHGEDWNDDRYHWIDVRHEGEIGRVGAWDACHDEDCPDGRACCTENKQRFATPGYLIDVETRTAKRLWGVDDAEDTLNDRVDYRICAGFDPDEIANPLGVYR